MINAIKIEDTNLIKTLLYSIITFSSCSIKFSDSGLLNQEKFFKYRNRILQILLIWNQRQSVWLTEFHQTGINEWISGGKGKAETNTNAILASDFWHCRKVVSLTVEMDENYNLDKVRINFAFMVWTFK
jgi:hypothetical protein